MVLALRPMLDGAPIACTFCGSTRAENIVGNVGGDGICLACTHVVQEILWARLAPKPRRDAEQQRAERLQPPGPTTLLREHALHGQQDHGELECITGRNLTGNGFPG